MFKLCYRNIVNIRQIFNNVKTSLQNIKTIHQNIQEIRRFRNKNKIHISEKYLDLIKYIMRK